MTWQRIKRWLCPPPPPKSETREGRALLAALRAAGLLIDTGWANPVDHIGAAWKLAKHHGIELGIGTSSTQLRAYLPKERWRGQPIVNYIPLGDWVERADLCEAICICALNCRRIGVL